MPQPCSTVRINGPALRDLRTERGLTVSQLAAKIGRHPQSVRKLETAAGKIASEVFARQIAAVLQIKIAEFTITDDSPEADDASETNGAAALWTP